MAWCAAYGCVNMCSRVDACTALSQDTAVLPPACRALVQVLYIARSVASALEYLHPTVVHRVGTALGAAWMQRWDFTGIVIETKDLGLE